MATLPSSKSLDDVQTTSQAIDLTLQKVASKAREACSPESFCAVLFEVLLPAMAADIAAVWLVGRDQEARRFATSCEAMDAAGASQQVEQVVRSGHFLVLRRKQEGERPAATVFLSPMADDDGVVGVLEVHRARSVSGEIQDGYVELLSAFAELATDFQRRHQLRQFRFLLTNQERFDSFVTSIHQSLNLAETCYAVANEGRRLVGCDRLSVLVNMRGRFKTQAVSGLDSIDSRSEEICQLERLARAAAATGEPLWFDGDASDQPPVIEALIQSYVDLSCARTLAVIPLQEPLTDGPSPTACIGVLVFEQFEGGPFQPGDRETLAAVVRHGTPAIRSALNFSGLPLLWMSRLLQRCGGLLGGRRLPRSVLVIAVTLAFGHLVPAHQDRFRDFLPRRATARESSRDFCTIRWIDRTAGWLWRSCSPGRRAAGTAQPGSGL